MTVKESLEKISFIADRISDVSYLELKELIKNKKPLDARETHENIVLMIAELLAIATNLEYSVSSEVLK